MPDLLMLFTDGRLFVEHCWAEFVSAGVPIVVVSAAHKSRSANIARQFSLDALIGTVEGLVRPGAD